MFSSNLSPRNTLSKAQKTLDEAITLFANGQRQLAITKIMAIAESNPDLTVKQVGHNNNLIFKLSGLYKEPVIIQLTTRSYAAEDAYKTLINADPNWIPHTTYTTQRVTTKNGIEFFHTASIMEYCAANLGEVVEELQKEKDCAKRINIATQIARGLSDILQFLTAHKLIWTDIKPGNIMLRNQGDQVIVDFKAISNPERLATKDEKVDVEVEDGKFKFQLKGYKNIFFADTTDPYLSENFRTHQRSYQRTPADARLAWEQEYSYQLAVLIHFILATPETPRLSPVFTTDILKKNIKTSFDFEHEIFRTPAGQAMQEIIQLLGAHDSNQRIHHSEVSELLSSIKRPEDFVNQAAKLREAYTDNRKIIAAKIQRLEENLPRLLETQQAFQAAQQPSPRRRSSLLTKKGSHRSRSSSKSRRGDKKLSSPRSKNPNANLQRMTSSPDAMFHTPTPRVPDAQTLKRRHKSAPSGSKISPRGIGKE